MSKKHQIWAYVLFGWSLHDNEYKAENEDHKDRSQRYGIYRPMARHGHKNTKYKLSWWLYVISNT